MPAKTADAVIVGGGIAGVCTAYYLAKANKRVVVTDKAVIKGEIDG